KAFPERRKRRHILRIEDRHAVEGNQTKHPSAGQLVLHHVHALDVVPRHGRVDVARHSAQVLPHDQRLVAMRLEAEYRVELLGWVLNVRAMRGFKALWNPEEPVKAHDVIHAKQPGVPERRAEASEQVAVAPPPAGRTQPSGW